MIDLETLSVRPDAVILIIGAIKFDRTAEWSTKIKQSNIDKQKTFYAKIDIGSCTDLGMRIEPETQKWWREQDKKVKDEAFGGSDRIPLKQALEMFSEWFKGSKFVWGHGSVFDIAILGDAYKRCGMDIPWKFWMVRDTRTVYDMGSVRLGMFHNDTKHNALFDCYTQVLGLQKSFKNLDFI